MEQCQLVYSELLRLLCIMMCVHISSPILRPYNSGVAVYILTNALFIVCLQWKFEKMIFGVIMYVICSRLYTLHGSNSSWLIFCEGHTTIDLFQMLELLNKYSPTEVTTVFNLCLSAVQCRSRHSRDKCTGCGNGRWMELTENHVPWWALVLNRQVLLPEASLF